MKDLRSVQTRIIATFILLFVATVIYFWTTQIPPPPHFWQWLSSVSSGLFVLGAAGIWVSYFAERQAIKTLTQNIDARFSILRTILLAGINDMFYCSENCRDDERYRSRVKSELQKAKGEIRLLAVAGREFFFKGFGFAWHDVESLIQKAKGNSALAFRVLLLHPLSEQGVSRGLREDPARSFDSYEQTYLWGDVTRACQTIVDWIEDGYPIETRLYKLAPACFLLFVNDVLFVEFYHFGASGRASGKVPLLEIPKGTEMYRQLDGHFQFVWDTSSSHKLDSHVLHELTAKHPQDNSNFVDSLRFSRPDLFDTSSQKENS
jgi:hypothetical protein